MPDSVLDRIVAAVEKRLEERPEVPDLVSLAHEAAESRNEAGLRAFAAALRARAGRAVIAECKHASPSAGVLRSPFDPVQLATAYEEAGATAISVVTEPDFFRGQQAWIGQVRQAVSLPVLRKDFIIHPRQLFETALLGADVVLLIQRLLTKDLLAELLEVARSLHIEVLLELFADEDPAMSVSSGTEVIGINARDLATFEIDLDRVVELADEIPADRVRVAESGITGPGDIDRLGSAGFHAFLIGEHLVRAPDPSAALSRLIA